MATWQGWTPPEIGKCEKRSISGFGINPEAAEIKFVTSYWKDEYERTNYGGPTFRKKKKLIGGGVRCASLSSEPDVHTVSTRMHPFRNTRTLSTHITSEVEPEIQVPEMVSNVQKSMQESTLRRPCARGSGTTGMVERSLSKHPEDGAYISSCARRRPHN